MAGSPGAGKTEWARSLIVNLANDKEEPTEFVHIDPDEIRKLFDGYNGTNVSEFTRATSTAVGRILDRTNRLGQNVIVDGTLSRYDAVAKDVDSYIGNMVGAQ
ncbi:zeta toxin family protein [Candidatus Saccharibacteria bacterium]|nr:zeta toxin family protein [Candidatus Saccharibacteria bacterium]